MFRDTASRNHVRIVTNYPKLKSTEIRTYNTSDIRILSSFSTSCSHVYLIAKFAFNKYVTEDIVIIIMII